MIKKILETDEYLWLVLFLIAGIGFAVPWVVARLRDSLTRHHRLRKPRCSVWVSLLATVLVFPLVFCVAPLGCWGFRGS
jgi:hypothetical protein